MKIVSGVCALVVAWGVTLAAGQAPLVVPLKFSPQGGPGAGAVALPPSLVEQPIDLRFIDAREAPDPRGLGAGTDDDDRPFPIQSSIDVAPFVEQVLGQLADAQQIKRAASAGRRLQLRLTRFRVDESNKAVGSTYTAQVHFAYVMTDASGTALVEGAAAGTANRYGRARSGANCAEVLSDALRDAFGLVLADPPLQAAWRLGAATPGAAAGPAKESVEQRLIKLNELLKKGLITQEEYKVKRAEILKEA